MNIQVDPTSSNLASAMLNSKIRPRAVVGYGVKIFHPNPPNYVTRSPGNYCAETWNFCGKGATTKLEKLNERALRFVYRDHSLSYEMLLKQSGYQTLLNQRLAKILTTVYKVVNRQCVSESLCDLVELRKSNYNLRGDKILTLPKVNTIKYGLKSVRYEGANLWNKLPNEYRKADS